MSVSRMCPPALLYLAFSLTHVLIDTFRGNYSTALTKSVMMVVFTLVLNFMCQNGLSIISWIIVFLPFILMTYITAVLMYVFGLQPSSSHIESSPIPIAEDETKEDQMPKPTRSSSSYDNSTKNSSCAKKAEDCTCDEPSQFERVNH